MMWVLDYLGFAYILDLCQNFHFPLYPRRHQKKSCKEMGIWQCVCNVCVILLTGNAAWLTAWLWAMPEPHRGACRGESGVDAYLFAGSFLIPFLFLSALVIACRTLLIMKSSEFLFGHLTANGPFCRQLPKDKDLLTSAAAQRQLFATAESSL